MDRQSNSLPEFVKKPGHSVDDDPYTFVLSDESVDRMGDVIRADGWDIAAFEKNPVALYGHNHEKPIGRWENVHVAGKKLVGTLRLAKQGTSAFIDSVRSLIEQGILKAVSVGFQPIEAKPRKDGGYEFVRSALHEVSVVAVPANANALVVARALIPHNVDDLFAKPGTTADDGDGRLTNTSETPNLDAARERFKALGID